jgi:hypothetical protein
MAYLENSDVAFEVTTGRKGLPIKAPTALKLEYVYGYNHHNHGLLETPGGACRKRNKISIVKYVCRLCSA